MSNLDSSEGSLPLIRRQLVDEIKNSSAEKLKRKRVAVLRGQSSSDESDLPSWLRERDSAERGHGSDERAAGTQQEDISSKSVDVKAKRTPTAEGDRNRVNDVARLKSDKPNGTPMIYLLSSSSDSEDDVPLAMRQADLDMEDLPPTQVDDTMTQQATQVEQAPTQGTPVTAKNPSPGKKQKQNKAANVAAKKLSPGILGKDGLKSISVVVPDRLPGGKLIMELETNDAIAGATDLSGDTGAIGRILKRTMAAADGESTLDSHELDLKGRLYTVTPVEFPGTIMVLNFTGNEAKVESFMEYFVQLREDTRFRSEENEEKMRAWLEEDDDNDEVSGAGGKGAKGIKTKPRPKAKPKPKPKPGKPSVRKTAAKKRPMNKK
jgi:hypothetical protein